MNRLLGTTLTISATLLLLAGCASQREHSTAWPDGRPQHVGMLDDHKPIGQWTTYHQSGTIASQGVFIAGRQDGRWIYGHPDGSPAGIGHWRDGVQHGWWTATAADGQVSSAGLMHQGRRVGPWLANGALRIHGSTEPVRTPDTITWQPAPAAAVSWLVGAASVAVEARWDGGGSPWHERFSDATLRTALAALLPGAAAAAVASQSEMPAAVPAAAATLPEDEQPASTGVELTPLPPLIEYGAIIRTIASSIRSTFTGDLAQTAAAPAPPALPAMGGDPLGQTFIGRPLPQTTFISSSGGLINLAKPERTTVVILMRGFSGTVCLYCAAQTAALADAAATFATAGIDVLVIYPGATSTIPAFVDAVRQLRKEPPPLQIALDVNLLLVRGLGVDAELAKPTSVILKRDGTIGWAYVGTSMSDRPSAATLLAAARALP